MKKPSNKPDSKLVRIETIRRGDYFDTEEAVHASTVDGSLDIAKFCAALMRWEKAASSEALATGETAVFNLARHHYEFPDFTVVYKIRESDADYDQRVREQTLKEIEQKEAEIAALKKNI